MKRLFFLTLFLQSLLIFAQNSQVQFTNYTIDDGLSLSSVYCILEDKQGFMWFGTEDGLNRFDGINFEIFRQNINEPNSLSNKWIENIFEDNDGFLWIFTQKGLNKYNPETKKFQVYIFDENSEETISSDLTTCIFQDNDNNLWIGTQNGINLYDQQKNSFKRFLYNENTNSTPNYITSISETENTVWFGTKNGLFAINKNDFSINDNFYSKKTFASDQILDIFLDNENLWLATDSGLVFFDINNQILERYLHNSDDKTSISDNYVEKIFKDSENNLWISTKIGFDIFNPEKQKFELLITTESQSLSLSQNNKRPIFEDNMKIIWFGTFGNGLFSYDLQTKKIKNYLHNPNDANSISQNSINSITQDNSNVIWFGTFGAGLNTYDPYKQKFNILKNEPSNPNSLSSNFVWSICEANSGIVWIGTNEHGVDKYNPKTEKFENFQNIQGNPNSLSHNCVREIYQDSKQNLWFGTNGGGLNKFNSKTENFKIYKHNPDNSNSLSNNSVRVIFEDKDGILWLGTQEGLNKFNPETEVFKRYLNNPEDDNSLSNNFIYSVIFQDSEGFLWLGTYGGGLNKFDIESETFTRYMHDEKNQNSIINDFVFAIQEDTKGNLWIATNDGLEYFDKKTGTFRHYTTANGLPNNVIYSVLMDGSGDLWMSTNYGISNYKQATETFKNYIKADGLQSTEFNGGAFHKGKSGTMYFAGVNGLNFFNPENIKINPTPPIPIISKLLIFNKEIIINNKISDNKIVEINNEYFLNKDIIYTDEIVLTYQEKVFSFDLSAIHNSNPQENIYSYRLRNFEEDWNYTKNRRFVTYTSIPMGEYFFEFKAANSDGVWSEIKVLKIIIKPPFWKTIWFYVAISLLTILTIFIIYKLKIRQIKRKNEELEEQVVIRTQEILEKNEELQQQQQEILAQSERLEDANIIITKKNKDTLDSINYASKIQQALLPSQETINQYFPENFILFIPRDIVSGDFYWFKIVNNFIVFAVADCTGHGVPGAFMSMLGIAFLNEIVRNKEIKTASQVLNKLRERVKISLKQIDNTSDLQDGMDIGLCVIDLNKKTLDFSGAYRPLYLLRKNTAGYNLETIKGDRMPIGIYLKESQFTSKAFDLKENDIIYLFTDGYTDQFSNIGRRKFTTKRFKKLVLSIQDKPMSEQKNLLLKNLEDWKKHSKQLDDILVLGIKINLETLKPKIE